MRIKEYHGSSYLHSIHIICRVHSGAAPPAWSWLSEVSSSFLFSHRENNPSSRTIIGSCSNEVWEVCVQCHCLPELHDPTDPGILQQSLHIDKRRREEEVSCCGRTAAWNISQVRCWPADSPPQPGCAGWVGINGFPSDGNSGRSKIFLSVAINNNVEIYNVILFFLFSGWCPAQNRPQ